MFTSNCHPPIPPEPWLSRRPDLWLHDILHRTSTGGVRAGCDAQLLAMAITAGLIRATSYRIPLPHEFDLVNLPPAHGNEGEPHRRLRNLGLALARAIDPQSRVDEECRAPLRNSSALLDIYSETQFGRIAIELGARDGRSILPILDLAADHILILPFAGWEPHSFSGWWFHYPHVRKLPAVSTESMTTAIERMMVPAPLNSAF